MTSMSEAMTYSYLENILTTPDKYLNKRLKLNGYYGNTYYEETNMLYHFCLVRDVTLCCFLPIEYMPVTADYIPPAIDTSIMVSGILQQYEEDGQIYYHIVADEIHVLS